MLARSMSVLIGLLLAASAALKFVDIAGGRDQSARLWLDLLLILFEFALGLGLVFARRRGGLWLIALVTFLVFVAYNLHAIRIGQASCGCFGAVQTSPWAALVIDLCALVALAVWAVADRRRPGW